MSDFKILQHVTGNPGRTTHHTRHAEYTHSELAWKIVASWEEMKRKFIVVMPKDYKRVLASLKRAEEAGLSGEEASMEAFEENKSDLARVSGN